MLAAQPELYLDIGLYALAIVFPPLPVIIRYGVASWIFAAVAVLSVIQTLVWTNIDLRESNYQYPPTPLSVLIVAFAIPVMGTLISAFVVWSTLPITGSPSNFAADIENQPFHTAPADSKAGP